MSQKSLEFLAISGSLRARSSNTSLLRAMGVLAPSDVKVSPYDGMAALPHFNPDFDDEKQLTAVADFRALVGASDAVLISSPEYAHGVPGALKNALDWTVSSGEFMNKPVALINTSRASSHAHASLVETLTVMMAKVSAIQLPLDGNHTDEGMILSNLRVCQSLREVIAVMVDQVRSPAEH
jgi:chromate reductase, NAD(P)H dehydrogenase (quinone)